MSLQIKVASWTLDLQRSSEIFGEFSEMHFLGNIVWTGSMASQKIDLYWTKFGEVFKNSLYYLLVPTASRFAKVR